jgi:uncharacterized protein (DUF433 family)
VCGGSACIAGVRHPVWLLIESRRAGWSDADLLADFPHLTPENLAAAWEYAAEHESEIATEIAENEAAGLEDRPTLIEILKAGVEECRKYETCMALHVSEDGKSVDLVLDTSRAYYGEWIKGEGADICLYRDMDTNEVVGCHLPLMDRKLVVSHRGPFRLNEGFRKEDVDD